MKPGTPRQELLACGAMGCSLGGSKSLQATLKPKMWGRLRSRNSWRADDCRAALRYPATRLRRVAGAIAARGGVEGGWGDDGTNVGDDDGAFPFFPITGASMAIMMVSVVVPLIWIVLSLMIVVSLVRIVLSLIIVLSLVWSAEQATHCTRSTTHAGTDRSANYAAYRSRSTTTLVRALVSTALHAAEDALRLRLMRNGEQGQRCCSSCYWKYVFDPHRFLRPLLTNFPCVQRTIQQQVPHSMGVERFTYSSVNNSESAFA